MKKIFILFLSIVMALSISCVKQPNTEPTISVVTEHSCFYDFEVVDNKVYIECDIALKNTFSDEKEIMLSAMFPEEVKLGLLKEEEVFVRDSNGTKAKYTLQPKTEMEILRVVFIGDYGGTKIKSNKLLPEIKVHIVK